MIEKKHLSSLLIILLLFILVGCLDKSTCSFQAGTFEYQDEPINFFDDLSIDEFTITLTEITKDEFRNSENTNVLINHKNDLTYRANISFKYTIEEESQIYNFKYLGKIHGANSYRMKLYIDNDAVGISGEVTITMYFNADLDESTCKFAKTVYIRIDGNKINGEVSNILFKSFPHELKYIG